VQPLGNYLKNRAGSLLRKFVELALLAIPLRPLTEGNTQEALKWASPDRAPLCIARESQLGAGIGLSLHGHVNVAALAQRNYFF
jgi:hypothetical protein